MANVETVTANLPVLIQERTDSLKLETAIRYMGDIIFNASQDRDGEKARWLARVLTLEACSRSEEVQARKAILSLFRDGYLDRYADYSALRDIAFAATASSIAPRSSEVFAWSRQSPHLC